MTPIVAKEVVYQATDYLGYGRMLPFLNVTNEILTEIGIELPYPDRQPLPSMIDWKKESRRRQNFGEHMKEVWKASHINRWLAANCFGDYYTRKGLTLAERELITFCFLMAQGGCEPQLIAHTKGNMNMGNDRDFLLKVVSAACRILVIPGP